MAAEQLKAVGRAVLEQVAPQPHAVRLVHADVDAIRAHAGAQGAELRVDERIGALVVNHQDVALVAQGRAAVPLEELLHVPQRLDAGHQLHARLRGVIVERAQLLLRIAPAQVALKRVFRHGIGVLRVEHQQVHAQRGERVNQPARGVGREHRPAGDVRHHAAGGEAPRLMDGKRIAPLAHTAREQEQRAGEGGFILGENLGVIALERDGQPLPGGTALRGEGVGERKADHGLHAAAGGGNGFFVKHRADSFGGCSAAFLIFLHYTGCGII